MGEQGKRINSSQFTNVSFQKEFKRYFPDLNRFDIQIRCQGENRNKEE